MQTFKKVLCPDCGRVLAHYIEGSGTDSIYRVICPRCGNSNKPVIIYSAGKTVIARTEISIEINIKL